jgi:hypothetical protein
MMVKVHSPARSSHGNSGSKLYVGKPFRLDREDYKESCVNYSCPFETKVAYKGSLTT